MDNQSKFCIELKALVNSICRKMAQQPFTKGRDSFTSIQIWIIHYLYDNQDRDVFQRDLETDFNVRRSTVSGILQNLEKKGLVQRQSVAQDARLKKITLTQEAKNLYNEMLIDIISMEQLMTENVTEEEWIVFYQVLEKIKGNLE
ncbi:MarR family winged helix-turn-helix transcriptional regulator [Anaerotignum sp.]|uniref:MarR family winged helix-turn-helix transcriptional regulator n=1 Tax=Anaerotignum sp. TaxID=2039241 RepID=UPI002714CFE9|nr:MarR family winged helix-turn-helix transcriptional regulator [Anaerotignum sp.]